MNQVIRRSASDKGFTHYRWVKGFGKEGLSREPIKGLQFRFYERETGVVNDKDLTVRFFNTEARKKLNRQNIDT